MLKQWFMIMFWNCLIKIWKKIIIYFKATSKDAVIKQLEAAKPNLPAKPVKAKAAKPSAAVAPAPAAAAPSSSSSRRSTPEPDEEPPAYAPPAVKGMWNVPEFSIFFVTVFMFYVIFRRIDVKSETGFRFPRFLPTFWWLNKLSRTSFKRDIGR